MTHHPECDGNMTVCELEIEGGPNGYLVGAPGTPRAFFATRGQAEAAARKAQRLVDCDGRCNDWTD